MQAGKFLMVNVFARYISVGAVNTLIHWVVFAALFTEGQTQSFSNFAAFCAAVTFSFFANEKWTINSEAATISYLVYLFIMGGIASAVGLCSDRSSLSPVITLVIFSSISLLCGFSYYNFISFKKNKIPL